MAIKVAFPNGTTLELVRQGRPWKWKIVDDGGNPEQASLLLTLADTAAALYHYSPAHGEPGALLAHQVAEQLGGKAIVPPPAPAEPGMLY